jgi:hypothetical protein
LKKAYNRNLWKTETEKKAVKKLPKPPAEYATEEVPVKSFPLASTSRDVFPNQTLDSSEPVQQTLDTPISERTGPSYSPPLKLRLQDRVIGLRHIAL